LYCTLCSPYKFFFTEVSNKRCLMRQYQYICQNFYFPHRGFLMGCWTHIMPYILISPHCFLHRTKTYYSSYFFHEVLWEVYHLWSTYHTSVPKICLRIFFPFKIFTYEFTMRNNKYMTYYFLLTFSSSKRSLSGTPSVS